MLIDSWFYCTEAAWNALAHTGEENDPWPTESWVHAYQNAITGYWDNWQGTHQVFMVLGSDAQLDALEEKLGAGVARRFDWHQGPGLDRLDINPTIIDDVLAVMKDHITYDMDGNPTGTTPATLENPNWGVVKLGQSTRIFAGKHSDDFSEAFR